MIASKNVNVLGKIQTLYTIPNFGPFLYGQDRLLALELNIEISAGAEILNITIIFCLGDSFIQKQPTRYTQNEQHGMQCLAHRL